MIKANELRIGNLVNVPRPDQSPFRIDEIEHLYETQGKVGQHVMKGCHPLTWYLENLSGVPLSEEILERCGFEWINDQTGCCFKRANVYMYFDYKDHSLSANFGHIEQLDVSIKYLHQLQNFIFALTGEDLTLKLIHATKEN